MLQALESVFSIILTIAIGFILAKRNWFEGTASALVSRLVVGVALPAYMVANLMGAYDRDKLCSLLPGLPIPFLVMLVTYAVGRGLAVLFRLRKGRRGTFASMFALSNTIFVGLPVNLMLFGGESLPFVFLYYIANTTLFWTVGVSAIETDGAEMQGRKKPYFISAASVRRIFSPPLTAFLLSILLIILGVKLPAFALSFCKTIGAMTTPLSMLFIGIVLSRVEWRDLKPEVDIVLIFVGRFLVAPGILFLMVKNADLPILMKEVFFMQATMPAMTQTPILASAYGADTEYAGLGTALTTVLSLVTIPLFMLFVHDVF